MFGDKLSCVLNLFNSILAVDQGIGYAEIKALREGRKTGLGRLALTDDIEVAFNANTTQNYVGCRSFIQETQVGVLIALITSDLGSLKDIVSENISKDRGFRALSEASYSSLSKFGACKIADCTSMTDICNRKLIGRENACCSGVCFYQRKILKPIFINQSHSSQRCGITSNLGFYTCCLQQEFYELSHSTQSAAAVTASIAKCFWFLVSSFAFKVMILGDMVLEMV
ncbi:ABC transporter B family member 28 [Camellia lanceoleosa]|uniref:ABC transporter B family member 28 n=1 Tax=Camellia lanceoleosa TaxID=1840588 RepID=A0ACC0H884_9ERIC|nr:ABC transporter B family member 28 [Camellia lanceoleosa]